MTFFEWFYLLAEPGLPALPNKVRRELKRLVRQIDASPVRVLDVGARKSPYTIGLPAEITLLDVPRAGEVMERLHLGFTQEALQSLKRRRSNIADIVVQDMIEVAL